ncbi:hypothetical protein [Vibrio sp. 03-59-1]|uniref:hypothetical protein n=1 Tax=Vibrio sp. 03-59-1 TaxID=2607607 RepID=UPI0020A5D174|nr:hypothetical protein [Vibrio sp. 03-59-1]
MTLPLERAFRLTELFEERYQLMMDSFVEILVEIPAAEAQVDNHSIIAEIDGIALNYLFCQRRLPIDGNQKPLYSKTAVIVWSLTKTR